MDTINIRALEKSKTQKPRARICEYQGKKYLDLRTFVVTGASDERAPTKKGITCPVNLIPELRTLIGKAEVAARGQVTGR